MFTMITQLEVGRLKARFLCSALLLPLAAISLNGQQRPGPGVPRIMIPPFQSIEKPLRVQAPEAVRNRLSKAINSKDLYVVTKADIEFTLDQSGYPKDEPLVPNDARALANQLNAKEYVEGTAAHSLSGYRITASWMVPVDKETSVGQPLPVAEAPKLADAAQMIAKSILDARKQLAGEAKCRQQYRQGNYREAVAAAWTGVAAYPNATVARTCIGRAYYAFKAKDSVTFAQYRMEDSVLAVANEIRAIDPRNIEALTWGAVIYQARGEDEKAIEWLTAMLAADPTNLTLTKRVATDLAANDKAGMAVNIIREALNNNPADPGLLSTAWLVFLKAGEWDEAISAGTELIKIDTLAADSGYYVKLGAAYTAAGKLQQAADAYAAGTAKYPNNADLWIGQAIALRKSGQLPQALTAAKRALALNPKVDNGYVLVAQIFSEQSQPDSAIAAVRLGAKSGGDKAGLARAALALGASAYKAANDADPKDRNGLLKAITYLELSDELAPNADAKFFIGFASFAVGQSAIVEAQSAKSCELAKLARSAFDKAGYYLPQAARDAKYRDNAMKAYKVLPDFDPSLNSMQKIYCK